MARNKVLFNKRQIIEASFEIVNQEGAVALSARRIAKELNISSITMYNYVENIDAIKKEVVLDGFNRLYHEIYTDLNNNKKQVDDNGISTYCCLVADSIYNFAAQYKKIYLLMFGSEEYKFRKDAEVRPFYNYFSQLFKRGKISKGLISNYQKSSHMLEFVINSLILEHIQGICSHTIEDFEDYIRLFVSNELQDT